MGVSKTHGGMGFRNFSLFNQALLAKQVWRLWKSPDSLVAKIMKAKYYPDCSALDAPLGKKKKKTFFCLEKYPRDVFCDSGGADLESGKWGKNSYMEGQMALVTKYVYGAITPIGFRPGCYS
jgi:hypothetical protein